MEIDIKISSHGAGTPEMIRDWRERLGMMPTPDSHTLENAGGSLRASIAVEERISLATDAMRRVVKDQFNSDPDLLDSVRQIFDDSQRGVTELGLPAPAPTIMQLSALEAVVSFDGSRPTFLIRDDRIDLASSPSSSAWKTTLSPRLENLAKVASCVGCVEMNGAILGTATLVSPTLALTNRHVAQAIARFDETGFALCGEASVDFGREDGGRKSFDRRKVTKIVFAGPEAISSTVDHSKFDAALLELSASALSGEMADRALPLDCQSGLAENSIVAVIGYPGDWTRWVPPSVRNAHSDILARLLQGQGGAKRLAPGASGFASTAPDARSICHDATTINGNSGSPLLALQDLGSIPTIGLHYGGRAMGERANWAHLFSLCRDAPITTGTTFLEGLHATGVHR